MENLFLSVAPSSVPYGFSRADKREGSNPFWVQKYGISFVFQTFLKFFVINSSLGKYVRSRRDNASGTFHKIIRIRDCRTVDLRTKFCINDSNVW